MASQRDWLRDWRVWVGGGGVLMLLALGTRRVVSAVSAGSGTTIDRAGVARGYERVYQITPTDLLWLGRACIGEVNESASAWESNATRVAGAAILWALLQGFLSRGYRNYGSLTAFARAYCQPINPRWAAGGDLCLENQDACTAAQIARRARIAGTSWEALPQRVRWLVEAWGRGEVPNPVPGLTDWRAGSWAGAASNIGGNWFGAR